MTTTTYIPDPFLAWLWKQFIRILATCGAIGIIAFIASIVFQAIALMIDALHSALHEVHIFCISVNNVYMQSGLVGQSLIAVICLGVMLWIIYRGVLFLYQSFRGGQT